MPEELSLSSNSEAIFVDNLLSVAKELEKLTRAREFRKEFDNEVSNFPPTISSTSTDVDMESSSEQAQNECLQMEVYDDKDYDIEEIKFWNFISKNKGVKPSVIRTIVYKVPESSYIVRKCSVYIDEPETKQNSKESTKSEKKPNQILSTSKETQANDLSKQIKKNEKPSQSKTLIKNDKPKLIIQNVAKKPMSLSSKQELGKLKPVDKEIKQENVKYTSEDVIVIDEDDDIIGYDEEEDIDQKGAEKNKNSKEEPEDEEEDVNIEEEDDDIIEEYFDSKSLDKNQNKQNQDEYEFDEENAEQISNKKDHGLIEKSVRIKKQKGKGRPRVVKEKAIEPISSISVKKSQTPYLTPVTNSKISTRSKSTSSANKSLTVSTEKANKKMITSKIDKKKLDQSNDSTLSVSSSSSTMSTISTSILNNTLNEQSRVTRSKAKLIENSSTK